MTARWRSEREVGVTEMKDMVRESKMGLEV